MLNHKNTINALRKLTVASGLSCIPCVLACFLHRGNHLGWKDNNTVMFSANLNLYTVLRVKKCHKTEITCE